MTPTPWDHLFVLALLGAIPVWGRVEYRRLVRRAAAGGAVGTTRTAAYRSTITLQLLLAAVALVLWIAHGRAPAALGLRLRADAAAVLGATITAGGLAVLALQRFAVRRLGPEGRERLRAQFATTWALLPQDARERRWFRGLALAAGVCEELLYRGYLIAYAAHWAGPSSGALLAASAFGLGHAYQGARGVLKTFLVGVAAGWLYLETDSLLWPAILHVALDLQGGALGADVMRDAGEPR